MTQSNAQTPQVIASFLDSKIREDMRRLKQNGVNVVEYAWSLVEFAKGLELNEEKKSTDQHPLENVTLRRVSGRLSRLDDIRRRRKVREERIRRDSAQNTNALSPSNKPRPLLKFNQDIAADSMRDKSALQTLLKEIKALKHSSQRFCIWHFNIDGFTVRIGFYVCM